ncbi:cyanate transporter [Acinetobacter nosocomialis]|uniref:MFS transporter n=1 Tax=Acinetobacter nosocomialis TaxID=106654 RepID=A0A2L1VHY6_ACINO|nr:cyanate transporter [Acinetobacter nosocomialis]AVF44721.1 MFS transporter [Acinetobacter nosocomialis]MBP1500163.1 cyanate transporter [Acinetobacter nosocomialis]MCE5996444.1 cyanate transporter [Acinetobacter nosocomialis]MCH2007245.1 cyanate transporter [Acinetobacter nosocomialis]MDE1706841.1 cyanate transporter [Acinetobacter nosocomialis]
MNQSGASFARSMLIVTVALVGLNLRPFMTSIGPLVSSIRAGTGLSLQGIALLTLLPMMLMGVIAFIGPIVQSIVGERRVVLGALLTICIGCSLRFLFPTAKGLIISAVVIGLGVALIQAAFPGIIKREFSQHIGPMMGLYSAMLMGGGALGAWLAPVVSNITGLWPVGLAFFALPAVLALISTFIFLPSIVSSNAPPAPVKTFLKKPRTWLLMLCFGLINGGYSSVVAWLAPSFQDHGWSSGQSGKLLALLALSQAASALILPILARQYKDRRPWLWFTLFMQFAGFSGLAFVPEFASILWAICLGVGLGGCFALTLIVALDHFEEPSNAGALSALMQGGGFLLAAIPPWLVAALHDFTGTYKAGWIFHICSVILVTVLVIRLAPKSYRKIRL